MLSYVRTLKSAKISFGKKHIYRFMYLEEYFIDWKSQGVEVYAYPFGIVKYFCN